MARRNVREESKKKTEPVSEYYKLNTKAVEDLATADKGNTPKYSEKELRKYRSKSLVERVPNWARMLFLKAWFPGAVCFFIFWGLSGYLADLLDVLFVFGIVLGIVTDILTNNIIRYYAKTPGANDRWMMFPKKRYATFFFNIIYAMLLLACVVVTYSLINISLTAVSGSGNPTVFGVGPVLFGLLYMGFDMLFITMKRMAIQIVTDAKNSARRS